MWVPGLRTGFPEPLQSSAVADHGATRVLQLCGLQPHELDLPAHFPLELSSALEIQPWSLVIRRAQVKKCAGLDRDS